MTRSPCCFTTVVIPPWRWLKIFTFLALNVLDCFARLPDEKMTVTCTLATQTAATFTPEKQEKFLTVFDYYMKTYVHAFNSRGRMRRPTAPYSSEIIGVWLAKGDERLLMCSEEIKRYPCTLIQPLGPNIEIGVQLELRILSSRIHARAIAASINDPRSRLVNFMKSEEHGIGLVKFMMPVLQPFTLPAAAEERYYKMESISGDQAVDWQRIANTIDQKGLRVQKDYEIGTTLSVKEWIAVAMLCVIFGAVISSARRRSKDALRVLAHRRQARHRLELSGESEDESSLIQAS